MSRGDVIGLSGTAAFGFLWLVSDALGAKPGDLDPSAVCPGHPWGYVGAPAALLLIFVGIATGLCMGCAFFWRR